MPQFSATAAIRMIRSVELQPPLLSPLFPSTITRHGRPSLRLISPCKNPPQDSVESRPWTFHVAETRLRFGIACAAFVALSVPANGKT
jgi:hypothetical protein